MRKFILAICFFTCFFQQNIISQYRAITIPFGAIANNNFNSPMMREGKVGYGFLGNNVFDLANPLNTARLTVRDGIIAHYVSGTIGDFNNSSWCGLGIGNPSPFGPKPYGLVLADSSRVGFYNILNKDVIAGFGQAVGSATNRFRIRAYSNAATNHLDAKDILIANPNGAVGINAEPVASLYVNSVLTNNPGFPNPLFKAIAIEGEQVDPLYSTASALGNQQNSSLSADNVIVEGVRSQSPNFAEYITEKQGVGVNVQAVRRDLNANSAVEITNDEGSYAELAWQNLEYNEKVTTNPNAQPVKPVYFHISFRNGRPGVAGNNSFSEENKLPVATFTPVGRVGIATTVPNEFSGINPVFLDVNGGALIDGVFFPSDVRFKKDVNPIAGALDKIKKIQGTTYQMRHEDFPNKNFMIGMQYGYIAQELEKVIPEIAAKGSDGYYSVNYVALIPILSEAIKELDVEVTNLKTELSYKDDEISKLNNEIEAIKNEIRNLSNNKSSFGVNAGFELAQNTPNPTAGITNISYSIPNDVTFNNASINIYDLTGKMISSNNISDKSGALKLNVSNLAAGTYIYDLLVDGLQVSSKKMVVLKY